MKDWLGNDYDVGDKVIYAAMSGRSVTMVLAEVIEIFEGPKYGYAYYQHDRELADDEKEIKVRLQPLKSSRWKQHSSRTRYIDSRTGKGIDPFRTDKHFTGGYYENLETGKQATCLDYTTYPDFIRYLRPYEWGAPDTIPEGWRFVKQEFQPYVQKIEEEPKPVTITITENIVKWTGNELQRLSQRNPAGS